MFGGLGTKKHPAKANERKRASRTTNSFLIAQSPLVAKKGDDIGFKKLVKRKMHY
jgi:hypothetical protein